MRNKVYALVGLAVLAVGFFTSAQSRTRTLYVSKVAKGQVDSFLARLATEDAHVVVTNRPVRGAIISHQLNVDDDQELLLLEPTLVRSAKYDGERFRIDSLVAVVVPERASRHHIHLHDEPYTYVETVGHTMHSAPAVMNSLIDLSPKLRGQGRHTIDIDPAFLQQKLSEFSGEVPVDLGGKPVRITERGSVAGRNQARQFLKQEYEALGYSTQEHNYGSGINFIAERTGTDPSRVLIISAHLDSVSNAGADDDGAGTISALAIAKALKDRDLKHNLRILGFDQEENGLVGSAAYARSLSASGELAKLAGVVNLEMTGYDSDNDGAYHVIDCNENTSAELSQFVTDAVTREGYNLKRIAACTNRSDHAAFWRYNKPAIVISQNFFGPPSDANPCYHRSCDKVAKVNFAYMSEVTKAVAAAVADIVAE